MRRFSFSVGLAALLVSSGSLAYGPTKTLVFTEKSAAPAGAPAAAARAVVAARASWTASLDLAEDRVATMRSGARAVRLQQMHQGLPVALRGASVTFDAKGTTRLVAVTLEENLPGDVTPTISASLAVELAAKISGVVADPSRAALAIWPAPGQNVLAWVVYPGVTPGLPYAPVTVIDAKTGALLLRYNAVVGENLAQVYPTNPTKSPALIDVTLGVPGTGIDRPLENTRIKSLNCIDQQSVKTIFGIDVHTCDLLQTATSDVNGDFLIPPAADTDPEDQFSELSMFYHANRIYDRFRGWDANFTVQQDALATVSNLRLPDGYETQDLQKMADPNLPLVPFQNAFFAPSNPIFSQVFGLTGAAMWFGQGPNRDYSYDGDVVYHEFTHAVVAATLNLIGAPHRDEYGVVDSPGGMNEGIADYFSSALAGDPDVGEYASQDFAPGSSAIRSLTNPDSCPSAIGGEVHQDATLFSAGLWDVRATLDVATQDAFDEAVFAAMNTAPSGDLGYEELAAIMVASVSSAVDQATADALTAAWTARGVLPHCTRVLEYQGTELDGPSDLSGLWFAPGSNSVGNIPVVPGVVQIHDALNANTTTVTVTIRKVNVSSGGNPLGNPGTPFEPKLFVKFGTGPLTFNAALTPEDGTLTLDGTKSGQNYTFTTEAPAGATDLTVMVGSTGEEDGAYTNLLITTAESVGTGSTSGAGGGGSTVAATSSGSGAPKADAPEEDSGCGCHVPGGAGAPAGGALAAAALAMLLAKRRRSR